VKGIRRTPAVLRFDDSVHSGTGPRGVHGAILQTHADVWLARKRVADAPYIALTGLTL